MATRRQRRFKAKLERRYGDAPGFHRRPPAPTGEEREARMAELRHEARLEMLAADAEEQRAVTRARALLFGAFWALLFLGAALARWVDS